MELRHWGRIESRAAPAGILPEYSQEGRGGADTPINTKQWTANSNESRPRGQCHLAAQLRVALKPLNTLVL